MKLPDERAEQAAAAAQDDDDEGQRQHLLVETGIDREDGPADHAGEAGQPGAQAEDDGEEPRDPDADDPRHRRIVDAGADHGAEPRPLEQRPERGREDRPR